MKADKTSCAGSALKTGRGERRMKFMRIWAVPAHALGFHGRAAESGTWPILLCRGIAKSPLWEGSPQRTGGICRAYMLIIAYSPADRKGVAQYG